MVQLLYMMEKFGAAPGNNQNQGNGMSRGSFLKKLGIIAGVVAVSGTEVFGKTNETNEKPPVVNRADWDETWNQVGVQYSKKLGEKFSVVLNGQTYEKTVDVLPYLDNNFKRENLENVYKRCVIHHSDIYPKGGAYDQAKDIRNEELGRMGYNDVAYNFMIASDGTILEGRPCLRVGSNAGKTKESTEYVKRHLPGGVSDIANSTGSQYLANLRSYINAMKMDPDYGTLGIVLCGNYDAGGQPTPKQRESLTKILNWTKSEYDIPTNNIIFHKEVKSKVVEASGLTFDGLETVCPGKDFPPKSEICKNLAPDTAHAGTKSMLLEKFV